MPTATPIGTNSITAISRRYIIPRIYDNIYASNLMLFRLISKNKKRLQGGTQIEAPLAYSEFAAGGAFTGYDLLDISPTDNIKNGAWAWKQYFVPVTLSGLDLVRSESPEAVANWLSAYFELAQTQMAENLGDGVWSNCTTNTNRIDGLEGAVDDGGVTTTYAGLSRTTNTWWVSQDDSTTATLGLSAMQTLWGNCTSGGQHPTLLVGTQANYNRYWNLSTAGQTFPTNPAGQDEQLAQNGFTNLLFNGAPFCTDSHVPANHIFFLNERYLELYVNTQTDFRLEEFRQPVNQDAMTSLLLWYGNLILTNCRVQGKMSALTA